MPGGTPTNGDLRIVASEKPDNEFARWLSIPQFLQFARVNALQFIPAQRFSSTQCPIPPHHQSRQRWACVIMTPRTYAILDLEKMTGAMNGSPTQ